MLHHKKQDMPMLAYDSTVFLIKDSFLSHFLLAPGSDLAVHSMKTFGTISPAAIATAALSALCANLANYLLGFVLCKIYQKYVRKEVQIRHQQFSAFYAKYAFVILFLGCFTSFQGIMAFLAGFALLGILPFVVYSGSGLTLYYFFL
jgi:membrane protein YqaA with SNARE-associated domain